MRIRETGETWGKRCPATVIDDAVAGSRASRGCAVIMAMIHEGGVGIGSSNLNLLTHVTFHFQKLRTFPFRPSLSSASSSPSSLSPLFINVTCAFLHVPAIVTLALRLHLLIAAIVFILGRDTVLE
jgi:hypothetical protein